MSLAARSKWRESGKQAARMNTKPMLIHQQDYPADQIRRAKFSYIGLFLLMVTVWSTILIAAIFSLRVNKDSCEYCPVECTCRGSPPAWG